jgi:hypothetical protein
MKRFETRLDRLDRIIPLLPCEHEPLPFFYDREAEYQADKARRDRYGPAVHDVQRGMIS